MNSTQLIEYYNIRKEFLGEKATTFNLFLEGYGAGIADIDLRKKIEAELIDKACEWLCEHIGEYARIGEDGAFIEHNVVKDFKIAIEK